MIHDGFGRDTWAMWEQTCIARIESESPHCFYVVACASSRVVWSKPSITTCHSDKTRLETQQTTPDKSRQNDRPADAAPDSNGGAAEQTVRAACRWQRLPCSIGLHAGI